MISLCSCAVILVIFFTKYLAEQPHYHAMEVYWFHRPYFPRFMSNPHLPERNYLDITLTGAADSDRVRLDFGELYIREIYARHDTVNAVHFTFLPGCKYRDFVRVLDIANMELVNYYFVTDEGTRMWYQQPHHSSLPAAHLLML